MFSTNTCFSFTIKLIGGNPFYGKEKEIPLIVLSLTCLCLSFVEKNTGNIKKEN